MPWAADMGPPPPVQVWTGAAELTRKKAPGTGGGQGVDAVGATDGGAEPGWIEMVSIEMSPVKDLPRVAFHRTIVVPAASVRVAARHA